MPYRRQITGSLWHWCRSCSGWPRAEYQQREDKPSTWGAESLCEECAQGDRSGSCLHSVELRTGLASDQVLGPVRYR